MTEHTSQDLRGFYAAIKVTGMEKQDWIDRGEASKGNEFWTPETLASQKARVAVFRELLIYLRGQIKTMEAGADV